MVERGNGSGGECGGLLGRATNREQDRTLENVFDKVILNERPLFKVVKLTCNFLLFWKI